VSEHVGSSPLFKTNSNAFAQVSTLIFSLLLEEIVVHKRIVHGNQLSNEEIVRRRGPRRTYVLLAFWGIAVSQPVPSQMVVGQRKVLYSCEDVFRMNRIGLIALNDYADKEEASK